MNNHLSPDATTATDEAALHRRLTSEHEKTRCLTPVHGPAFVDAKLFASCHKRVMLPLCEEFRDGFAGPLQFRLAAQNLSFIARLTNSRRIGRGFLAYRLPPSSTLKLEIFNLSAAKPAMTGAMVVLLVLSYPMYEKDIPSSKHF